MHSPGSGSLKTCSRRPEARAPSGSCSFYWEKSCPSKRRQTPHPSRETHEGEPRLFLSTKNTWRQIRAYNSAKMHCQGKRVLLSPSPTFCSRHLCCPRAPLWLWMSLGQLHNTNGNKRDKLSVTNGAKDRKKKKKPNQMKITSLKPHGKSVVWA